MRSGVTLPTAVGGLVVAFLIAGGAWWLLESTVPMGEYDDVVAQLDAAEEDLATTQQALLAEKGDHDDLAAQLDATEGELASTQKALHANQARLQQPDSADSAAGLRPAALLLGYFAGVDRSIVDQQQYESWAGVVKLDTAVEAINDPELTELYWRHMGEGGGFYPGSDELVLRLIELTIEPILRGP